MSEFPLWVFAQLHKLRNNHLRKANGANRLLKEVSKIKSDKRSVTAAKNHTIKRTTEEIAWRRVFADQLKHILDQYDEKK